MNPTQLYAITPVEKDLDVSVLFGCYFNHMPEVGIQYSMDFPAEGLPNERIEVRYYKNRCYDGRRIWRLASLWLDGNPFMIIQNAGREGDDHFARFITDIELYKHAIRYIKALLPPSFRKIPDVVSPDTDIANLTTFYGDTL